MATVIALLRGVNIGGHHKLPMASLRELCESIDLTGVRTHLQSGNAVFRTRERNLARLAERLEGAIEERFGFRPAVILRTEAELRAAIARSPFAARRDLDPSRLVVSFFAAQPAPEALERALAIPTDPEELHIDGREAFIYFPNGFSKAKMSWPAIERALRTPATNRNWNTVTALLELAAADAGD